MTDLDEEAAALAEHLCAPDQCCCEADAELAEWLAFGHHWHVCGDWTRAGRCRTCGARRKMSELDADTMRARLRVQSHDLLELTTAEGVRAFFGAKRRKELP